MLFFILSIFDKIITSSLILLREYIFSQKFYTNKTILTSGCDTSAEGERHETNSLKSIFTFFIDT
jgi:hypothetical protein